MSAKIFLRHLNNMSTFNLLQDKLSRLNDTYLVSYELGELTFENRRENLIKFLLFDICIRTKMSVKRISVFLVELDRYECISLY